MGSYAFCILLIWMDGWMDTGAAGYVSDALVRQVCLLFQFLVFLCVLESTEVLVLQGWLLESYVFRWRGYELKKCYIFHQQGLGALVLSH